jgi:Tfp pilus assembly protein FimV
VGRETGADEVTDRQTVLAILRRNPGVVEDVIDTVIEWHEQHR